MLSALRYSFYSIICLFFCIDTVATALEKPTYPAVQIIGSAVPPYDWTAGVEMSTTDGVIYWLKGFTLPAGEVKFRQDASWAINWGASSFPDGFGFQGGPNIPVSAGVYTIVFNRESGEYNFYRTDGPRKKFVNDAVVADDFFTGAAGNNNNPGTQQLPLASLQLAVLQAAAGDTIYVDAGNYVSQTTIDKPLTIIGADNRTVLSTPLTPLLVAPSSNIKGLLQTAVINGNVYFKNLTVLSSAANGYSGIVLQSGGYIKNCSINNAASGIVVRYNNGPISVGIYNNLMTNVQLGMNCQGSQLDVTVYNNDISLRNTSSGGFLVGTEFGPIASFAAGNNVVNNYTNYGFVVNSRKNTISNNSITGTGGYAIAQVTGVAVTAACNWFGVEDEAAIAARIYGKVNYSPWLLNGADISPERGLQSAGVCAGWRGNDYVFVGNGNWSNAANWLNNRKPPVPIPAGSKLVIDPAMNGQCLLDDSVYIPESVMVEVKSGKRLEVAGHVLSMNDTSIVLKANVHVVDSTQFQLISGSAMLANGVYQFSGKPDRPYAVGDVLVGLTGEGYLRRINTISIDGTTHTFGTSLATMEDVFERGTFSFGVATDSSLQVVPASGVSGGFTFPLEDVLLYDDSTVNTIRITNGSITLNPNWKGNIAFGLSGLKQFELSFENATMETNFSYEVTMSKAIEIPDTTKLLKRLSVWVPVPGVPVRIRMGLDISVQYSALLAASMSRSIDFKLLSRLNLKVKYQDGVWQASGNVSGDDDVSVSNTTANINAVVKAAIIPAFSFKFYGIVGPYAQLAVSTQAESKIVFPSLDWDMWAGAWIKTTTGVNASILGRTVYNSAPDIRFSDTLFYKTPYQLKKVSGDNQSGAANAFLTQPVKVQVLDNLGKKQRNVVVRFSATPGNGTVEQTSVLTDADGYASTRWKLDPGAQCNTQRLQVTARKADGTLLMDAPLEFLASGLSVHVSPDSTFTDPRDGQVYTFRHIGNQVWMTQNLNFAAPNSIAGSYGTMYLWNTAITVAPPGWHLPTDAEWDTLINNLCGSGIAGGKMKATTGWRSPNIGASNIIGFNAMPGGFVPTGAGATYIGERAYWWSSTPNSLYDGFAWGRGIRFDSESIWRDDGFKGNRFNVRCIRNN